MGDPLASDGSPGARPAPLDRWFPAVAFLFALAAAALFCFLTLAIEPGARIIQGVDGISYSLYVRSLVGDGDLDFADEIERVHAGELPGADVPTATGLRPNAHGVGVALLATPFYLVARGVDRLSGAHGVEVEQGWSVADRLALALAGIFWGWLGLVLTYRIVRRSQPAPESALALALLACGTNVLYYFVREPFQVHLPSLLAVAAGLLATLRADEAGSSPARWGLAGAAFGLGAAVELPNLLGAVVPAALLYRRGVRPGGAPQAETARSAAALVAGLAIGLAPQLLAWHTLYGSWVVLDGLAASVAHPADPRVLDVLFSSRHGLLTWSPLYALALAGLPLVARSEGALVHALALWVLLLTYGVASSENWWLGHSFGHRAYVGVLPVFALGLAALLARVRGSRARLVLGGLVLLAVVWNGLLMLAFLAEVVPYSGTFSWWDYATSLPDLPARVLEKARGG